ncbi:MAG: hypothetical protein WBA93_35375 [Microcoleaceae cyanobacterium]
MEALDQTWEWVSNHICDFQQEPHLLIKESLENWINGYLKWRIRDLYINQAKQHHNELSLDTFMNNNSEKSLTLLEQMSDNSFNPPTLSGINSYIEKRRNQNIQEIFERFERYVEEDPENILQNCHPRQYPDCNCQFLCQKLVFQHPPEKFANISKELKIKYDTLRSFWKRKCLPLLQKKLEEFGYSREEE